MYVIRLYVLIVNIRQTMCVIRLYVLTVSIRQTMYVIRLRVNCKYSSDYVRN